MKTIPNEIMIIRQMIDSLPSKLNQEDVWFMVSQKVAQSLFDYLTEVTNMPVIKAKSNMQFTFMSIKFRVA